MGRSCQTLFRSLLLIFVTSSFTYAQSSVFGYQGQLKDGGNPANGNYDLRFRLFDDPGAGTQIGTTQTIPAVQAVAGIFHVQLDFGAAAFTGADRYIEISVSPAGQNNFTLLTPRQKLASSPHAIQSLKAATSADSANLGGIAANQYVLTGDGRLSDARNPLPGSSNYVQNGNSPQAGVNFNIGGTGTANIINATTQFNIGGSRILSNAGVENLFAGINAGVNTITSGNAFFGFNAGAANGLGNLNSFFGTRAGEFNTTGFDNSFFGTSAGRGNTTGIGNSFFGKQAGVGNTIGNENSFFGTGAGLDNTEGSKNTFAGVAAGTFNTTGHDNVFLGYRAGIENVSGSNLTVIGSEAKAIGNVSFATAIGAGAAVDTSNTIMLGRSSDTVKVPGALNVTGTFGANIVNATTQFNLGGSRILSNAGTDNMFAGIGSGSANTGARNAFFGHMSGASNTSGVSNTFFGTFAGMANTIGSGNSFFGRNAGSLNVGASNNTFIGNDSNFNTTNPTGVNNTLVGAFTQINSGVNFSTAIGEGAVVTQSSSLVLGRSDVKVGIGTSAPQAKLHIKGDSEGIRIEGPQTGNGNGAYLSFADASGTQVGYVGDGSSGDSSLYVTSYVDSVNLYTPAGANLTATPSGSVLMKGGVMQLDNFTAAQTFDLGNFRGMWSSTHVLGLNGGFDTILASPVHVCARIQTLGGGFGGYALVRCSAARAPSNTNSDARPFSGGIDIIERLNPVSFKRKVNGSDDIGLIAEEVAAVEPSLVTRSEGGEVEDIKEGGLDLVFINAFKEQQEQIKAQREQIARQQQQIEALKKLMCASNPAADLCRDGK
jgi:hypothetical protein